MRRFRWMTIAGIGMAAVIGCSGGNSEYKKPAELKKAAAHHDDHEHGEKGPHGGSLVELGKEEYHAEVVLDHDAHALRVFILGKDAKTAQGTAAAEVTLTPHGKTALKLKAAPQQGDADGKASRFELIDDAVVHGLMDDGAIHGELRVTIADAPFSGEVDYHLDDVHHEHKEEMPSGEASKDAPASSEAVKSQPESTDKPGETAKDSDKK